VTRFRKWPHEIRDKVKALQHSPGVYQMKGKKGRILYVGKALSLRDRVSSYFNRSPKHGKNIEYMLSRLEDFDVLLTRTESEAFILEANLVKQFQPPYNILLKDDKQYPYIRITTNEAYPRLHGHAYRRAGRLPLLRPIHQRDRDAPRAQVHRQSFQSSNLRAGAGR
jgi:excinuclease UvrABC nuclease subunit